LLILEQHSNQPIRFKGHVCSLSLDLQPELGAFISVTHYFPLTLGIS